MTNKEKAFNEINKIIKILDEEKINHSSLVLKNYNYEITITLNKQTIKVQVYFGKKGIKTILQGNNETKEFNLLSNLILKTPKFSFDNKFVEPEEYIGSDEAGKGDFFGPLVISAVYVNERIKNDLNKIGVKDSKKLNEVQIKKLSNEIKVICKDNFSVIQIEPKEYNKLYEKFKNLNKILSWAHSKAIQDLIEKTKCKNVIIDKFSKQNLEIEEIKNYSEINFFKITKAEKYLGVAAASILARNCFNAWFEKMKMKGLILPKGSSIIVEEKALKILQENNLIDKNEICKIHFKTLKKIEKNIDEL